MEKAHLRMSLKFDKEVAHFRRSHFRALPQNTIMTEMQSAGIIQEKRQLHFRGLAFPRIEKPRKSNHMKS
jgi:hypothetical protein